MPRRIRDLSLAVVAIAAVLAALTGIEARVPSRIAQAISEGTSGQWTAPGSPVGDLLVSVAASPAADNVFATALVVTAVVLVFLMVRT